MRLPAFATVAVMLAAFPRIAAADSNVDAASEPMPFVTLDRVGGDSAVGLEATYPAINDTNGDQHSTVVHFDLHAHYVDPGSHFGGYINVPVSYLGTPGVPSTTALGDIELGGVYALPTSMRELAVILHAGLDLPTGSKDNAIANLIAEGDTRPRDVDSGIPGFTLRLGVSPVVRSGALFARGDVDLDINLSNSAGDTAKPILTVSGGVGVQLASVVLTGELDVMHSFADTSGTREDSTIEQAALAVRFAAGAVQPYAAVVVPLDGNTRTFYDFAITAGVTAPLR